jgi:DNA-binding response OmpR family regulator
MCILVIAPEPAMVWLLKTGLGQYGYTVIGTSNNDDGVAVLSRTPVRTVVIDFPCDGYWTLA